jgi:hypothetical protein
MSQRGCLRQIRIINLLARRSQLPNDVADGDGIPDQNGIGEQAQTAGLVHDFLVVTGAKLTAIGEEQPASQFMPRFASIELQLHSPSDSDLLARNFSDRTGIRHPARRLPLY